MCIIFCKQDASLLKHPLTCTSAAKLVWAVEGRRIGHIALGKSNYPQSPAVRLQAYAEGQTRLLSVPFRMCASFIQRCRELRTG